MPEHWFQLLQCVQGKSSHQPSTSTGLPPGLPSDCHPHWMDWFSKAFYFVPLMKLSSAAEIWTCWSDMFSVSYVSQRILCLTTAADNGHLGVHFFCGSSMPITLWSPASLWCHPSSATLVQVPGEQSGSALGKGQPASTQDSLVTSEQSVLRRTFLRIAWIGFSPFILCPFCSFSPPCAQVWKSAVRCKTSMVLMLNTSCLNIYLFSGQHRILHHVNSLRVTNTSSYLL